MTSPSPTVPDVDAFIRRWEAASGSELANYQLFVGELCTLIGVEKPQPSRDKTGENAYVFERVGTFMRGDGSTSAGRIDCYRRSAFVLEAKKVRQSPGRGFDDALLRRYVATPVTSKHRFFVFLDVSILPDDALMIIATDDAQCLGVLSSRTHVAWALAAGSTLEDRPRYIKSRCFEPFPFPTATADQQSRIRDLAEELDAHRNRQQAQHADLTLTGMYNVLEKLKSGEALTAKEQKIHADGLVSVLKTLHDQIDLAVLDAYGWSDLAPLIEVVNGNATPGSGGTPASRDECKRTLDDALLERLVALNAKRAAEEAQGLVRWLRPAYQNPASKAAASQPAQGGLDVTPAKAPHTGVVAADARQAWPRELADQIRAVAQVLASARAPLPEPAVAARFTGRGPWKRRLPQLLDTLVAVGRARPTDAGYVAMP